MDATRDIPRFLQIQLDNRLMQVLRDMGKEYHTTPDDIAAVTMRCMVEQADFRDAVERMLRH